MTNEFPPGQIVQIVNALFVAPSDEMLKPRSFAVQRGV